MNICYISDVDISKLNGPGVNEREFLKVMISESELRKDNVSFIIPKPSHSIDMKLKNVFYLPPEPKISILQIFRMLPVAFYLLYYMIQVEKVDFFLIRINPSMLPIICLFPLLRKKYCIKTLDNNYEFTPVKLSKINQVYLFLIRKMLGHVLLRSLFTDTCTPQLRTNYLRKYNIKNIAIIDNAVNTDRFFVMDKFACKKRFGLEKFSKIVGYCGGYPSQRGAKQLVELSSSLVSKYPELGILIVGDDPELKTIKKLAKELKTIDHIMFTGVVDYAKIPFYINCIDVGIGLDTYDKVRFVGNCSQKIRQYLACGVPVICPENTNTEIVKHGLGQAVPQGDIDAIFNAIVNCLDIAKTEREKISKKARLYATEQLSMEVAYERRYKYWRKALSQCKTSK